MRLTNIRVVADLTLKLRSRVKHAKELLFGKYFLTTNVVISTSFAGIGDTIEQYIERHFLGLPNQSWSAVRTLKLAATGFPVGYITHYWYVALDKRYVQNTALNILKKIVWSQLIYTPACILVFFLTLGLLERQSIDEMRENMITKGQRIYVVDWMFWPPVSLVNFYIVPLRYRLLYENTVSIGFDVFNSYVYHNVHVHDNDNKKSALQQHQTTSTTHSTSPH